MIGIICAMEFEGHKIKNSMQEIKIHKISSINFYSGELHGMSCVVAAGGVGKVNAAVCAQTMILKYRPGFILNIGVAGGLLEDMRVCDVVISQAAVQCDVDTTALGDPKGFISTIEVTYLPCSRRLADLILKDASIHYGTMASSDQFIADKNKLKQVKADFGAIACDMETASIAQVCYMNNVEFLSIRAISDNINRENSHLDYEKFKAKSAEKVYMIIKDLFANL
ncbi:MAG: 5'-methylthioadenosine/adenosylhomocysteine nucleosidase [Clostridia bacterium]|nr:5'-methylthioadenosine/adenosylhomocysteine nucleosidase [Clostridia bacterium]